MQYHNKYLYENKSGYCNSPRITIPIQLTTILGVEKMLISVSLLANARKQFNKVQSIILAYKTKLHVLC